MRGRLGTRDPLGRGRVISKWRSVRQRTLRLSALSDVLGDENMFTNSGHTLFDAALHYDLSKFDPRFTGAMLQVNGNNGLTSQDDVRSSNYCYLDQGRTVLGSLRYRW